MTAVSASVTTPQERYLDLVGRQAMPNIEKRKLWRLELQQDSSGGKGILTCWDTWSCNRIFLDLQQDSTEAGAAIGQL